MGRAKTPGNRTKGGKKKKPTTLEGREDAKRILPTPETIAYVDRRVEYWTHPEVWNRASAEHCFDNAGILWLTGWFDKGGFQADEIRNIFRTYAELYWSWYPAPKTSKHERVGRSEPSTETTKREELFMRLDERLPIGSEERKAVHQLCVDDWHSDEYHHRAVRLANTGRLTINTRIKGTGLGIAGELADERDMEWLNAALRGAFMLLDATIAKRPWDIPLWAMGEKKAA